MLLICKQVLIVGNNERQRYSYKKQEIHDDDDEQIAFNVAYTPCPKKTCEYIFYNNFNNKCPITIIFGTVSGKSMRHQKMVSFPTSPI